MRRDLLGFGIIGSGTIADIHAQALKNCAHARLISAFSRSRERVKAFSDRHGSPCTSDLKMFLENKELEAVVICTPNGTHAEYGVAAAREGKHVITEKPIEVNVSRGRYLIQECTERGVRLAVIYQNRFLDDVVRMKEDVQSGSIGRILSASASVNWYRNQEYYDARAWRGTQALDGGGALINQAIHTIDLMQWMMGEVDSVFGYAGTLSHTMEGEDNAMGVLRFVSGALGALEGSTSVQPPAGRRIEIHGSKGTALLEGDTYFLLRTDQERIDIGKPVKGSSGAGSPLAGFSLEPHRRQLESIAQSLLEGKEPAVSGRESLKSLAIVEALYRSAKSGLPVQTKDVLA